MTGELVSLAVLIVFGALAAGLIIYGMSRVRGGPKVQAKPATKSIAAAKTASKTTTTEKRFCHKCYAIIPEGLEFCSECGERQY